MYNFNDIVMNDLCSSLLGEKLGTGSARDVYVLSYDTSKVVKIAKDGGRQNILEYETWCSVQYSDYHSKWFAPCVWISDGGNVLIQERAVPIIPPKLDKDYKVMIDKIPDKIPNYFTDIKLTNFGFIDGRFCCVDYALNLMKEYGMTKRTIRNKLLDLYKGEING